MNEVKNNSALTTSFNESLKKMLSNKMTKSEIDSYIQERSKIIDSIDAKIDLKMLGFDGRIKCEPTDSEYPYEYNHRIYGIGIIDLKCEGLLTTGYAHWSGLWSNTTSVAVTSADIEIGVVLAVFFREDGAPIGDFRGVPVGSIGAIAAGGEGGWKKK
ncbi:hypothetical protein C7447_102400 [Tenacibaculum adriaticum]|uniref:Uncharacterized protein n=1 Tax=Tenacibaculum adriaticum TaxID=413713 RepID=A0A5S5DWD2_9FLAO|nr:hypothetical protein [Tenacibaculum adriaticum]TYP99082.1 hypothetical protein C7447_102400 [Tenacibaculum adriaticum]